MMIANDDGLDIITTLNQQITILKQQMEDMLATQPGLLAMQQNYHNVRQRTLQSWIRRAFSQDSPTRMAAIRETNQLIHGGDIVTDSLVVLERFSANSSEIQQFSLLYGLSATEFQVLDPKKCVESTKALNRMASILLRKNSQNLSAALNERRNALVTCLQANENDYDGAEVVATEYLLAAQAAELVTEAVAEAAAKAAAEVGGMVIEIMDTVNGDTKYHCAKLYVIVIHS
ncbi:hypothetical protein N7495_007749 [Penicillium taxi]|uniref:uncharacterized protein n=1 Tax=Penicillium taxi TaxID=168475 RepID=UPI002545567B|nr:uncharacterized protein N7495_007749 [Penicillium taxi]KAJ5887708.1 hypothetical protein N7495_007749 [Penicillium taxi]